MSILSDALKKADKNYKSKKTESMIEKSPAVAHLGGSVASSIIKIITLLGVVVLLLGLSWFGYERLFGKKTVATVKPVQHVIKSKAPIKKKSDKQAHVSKNTKPQKKIKKVKEENITKKKTINKIKKITKQNNKELLREYFNQALLLVENARWMDLTRFLDRLYSKNLLYKQVVEKLGYSLSQQANYEAATAVLERAYFRYPSDKKLGMLYARSLFKLNKNSSALKILNNWSPDLSTENENYFSLKALILLKLNDFAGAKLIYGTLSHNYPKNQNYALGYAICLQNMGNRSVALSIYRTSLSLAPPAWPAAPFVRRQIQMLSS